MKPMTPDEVRSAVHGRWRSHGANVMLEGVTTDSRTARPGQLFVAIKGPTFDGHNFLMDAARAGCIAAVVDREHPLPQEIIDIYGGGLIGVADTVKALGELAMEVRRQLSATTVAVTGSNGKTTVKRMIEHILSGRLQGVASPKSFNNAIGVPLTVLAAGPSDDFLICEVGASAPGEVLELARIVQPDLAVITSIGPAHLEGFGSIERIATEKASLLAALRPNGMAMVRGGQPQLDRAVLSYTCRMIRFGEDDPCELRLTGYESDKGGQRFQINDRRWVSMPIPGRHNALNALAAIAVAQRLGFDQQQAGDALASFQAPSMRLETIQVGKVTVINDAYNANPASTAAAAAVLADMPGRRRVMVLGDMRELGSEADTLHRDLGRQVAAWGGVDLLIGIGPLGQCIADGAAEGGVKTAAYESVLAAGELAKKLKAGDVVLIKGSRAMGMEDLIDPIRAAFA